MRHIPNILSCLRLLMVGIFVWLFAEQLYVPALIVYVTAFLTDVLDGYLARRFNWISNLGKLLDPFADKLMLISVLACLLAVNYIKWYLFAAMLIKELMMIVGGLFILRKKRVVVYADWWGKIATGMFFASVVFSLLLCSGLIPLPMWLINVAFGLSFCVSFGSMIHYAYCGGLIGKKYAQHTMYDDSTPDEN